MEKIGIENAIRVLERHNMKIQTVSEWAQEMGYDSTSYFSRRFRNHYGLRPKKVLVKKKLSMISECIRENPADIYYSIARKSGFIDNNALYKFVKLHTGMSITEFKRECKRRVRKKGA